LSYRRKWLIFGFDLKIEDKKFSRIVGVFRTGKEVVRIIYYFKTINTMFRIRDDVKRALNFVTIQRNFNFFMFRDLKSPFLAVVAF
jgi:hypothetical protein